MAGGAAARDRRARTADREGAAVEETLRQAVEAERAQRRHIAEGLRTTVLGRAERVVRHAEEGRLDDVLAEARSALAAMRELLATLYEPGAAPARDEGAGTGPARPSAGGARTDAVGGRQG